MSVHGGLVILVDDQISRFGSNSRSRANSSFKGGAAL
jgi:hypothetical protein